MSYNFPKLFLCVFHYFSHRGRPTIFFPLFLPWIQYLNQVCVLGEINEHYEALCDVCMYVCMCLKRSFHYGQPIGVFVFFHDTEWVNIFFIILNLEGQQNCIIGLKVTTILPLFFFPKNWKNLKHRHVGCFSRGNGLEFCTVHSDFVLGEYIWIFGI